MKKILVILAMLMATMTATHAITPNEMNKLTDVQQAELALDVAKKIEAQKAPGVSNPQAVKQWVNYGTEIGQALAGTARELGVVANDFIQTPAGKVTLAMIVWKVMGHDIIHVGLAAMMFFTLIPGWIYMFNRMCIVKGYEYEDYVVDGKPKTRRVKQYYDSSRDSIDGTRLMMALILGVILITIIVTGVN